MKKVLLSVLSLTVFFGMHSQTYNWTPGFYSNDPSLYTPMYTLNRVSIGVATGNPAVMLRLQAENMSNINDGKMSLFSSSSAACPDSKLTGTTDSRIGYSVVSSSEFSHISGIYGHVNSLTKIANASSTIPSVALGGFFSCNVTGLTIANNAGSIYLGGVYGEVSLNSGGIYQHPSMGAVAGIIGIDKINNTQSLAGYFKGKVKIKGKLEAEEIEVKTVTGLTDLKVKNIAANNISLTNIAADYVFDENYKLRSLEEVEAFVKENKHLPDVAPASETVKGVNIAEFNSTLLQKVEELTLYIIEQNKKIEAMQAEINAVKK